MCRGATTSSKSEKAFALANPPAKFKHRNNEEETPTLQAPSFEVTFNPTITNSSGCLRACRDAILESCPKARMAFVSLHSRELSNEASHIVISCLQLDGISLIQHQIAPCEIIRMEQRLMNSDNSTWCLAFKGLVALKIASRLTKVRQSEAVKALTTTTNSEDLPAQKTSGQHVKKIYRARKNPIFGFSQEDLCNSYTRQLDKLYKHYCPVKRNSVPMLIQQYRGREDYLLRKVKRKYTTRQKSNRQAIYV